MVIHILYRFIIVIVALQMMTDPFRIQWSDTSDGWLRCSRPIRGLGCHHWPKGREARHKGKCSNCQTVSMVLITGCKNSNKAKYDKIQAILTSQANSSFSGSRTHLPRKGPNLVPGGRGRPRVHTPCPLETADWPNSRLEGGSESWAARPAMPSPPPSSRLFQALFGSWAASSELEWLSSPANQQRYWLLWVKSHQSLNQNYQY